MPLHHLAHLKDFKKGLKVGYKIRRGDEIGYAGKTGTKYVHVHYEVKREKPDRWNQYVYDATGRPLTKDQVASAYIDPTSYINRHEAIPAPYTTFGGYEYLDPINKQGTAFHAGIDINDKYGDQDEGNLIKSPVDGEIVALIRLDGGWGNHIWIKEEEKVLNGINMEFALKNAGRLFISVQEKGEVYWIAPSGIKYYMGSTPTEMLEFVKIHAVGISVEDLKKFPIGK